MTAWTNPLSDPRDRPQTDVLLTEGHAALVPGTHAEAVRRLLQGGRTADELVRLPADPILILDEWTVSR